jgi:hypothetical protein
MRRSVNSGQEPNGGNEVVTTIPSALASPQVGHHLPCVTASDNSEDSLGVTDRMSQDAGSKLYARYEAARSNATRQQ